MRLLLVFVVVCAHDDIFVQRIYRDSTVLSSLRETYDLFFCIHAQKPLYEK